MKYARSNMWSFESKFLQSMNANDECFTCFSLMYFKLILSINFIFLSYLFPCELKLYRILDIGIFLKNKLYETQFLWNTELSKQSEIFSSLYSNKLRLNLVTSILKYIKDTVFMIDQFEKFIIVESSGPEFFIGRSWRKE